MLRSALSARVFVERDVAVDEHAAQLGLLVERVDA
jgi:hypothetical protein